MGTSEVMLLGCECKWAERRVDDVGLLRKRFSDERRILGRVSLRVVQEVFDVLAFQPAEFGKALRKRHHEMLGDLRRRLQQDADACVIQLALSDYGKG
jgi:hypothetical protein